MKPRVSVCMPTYNQAAYLPEAIESVLAQTYRDFELLILEDGSRDETPVIARRYAAADDRIQVIVNERNRGMVNNWNACLQHARGDYIKYLFGDDVLSDPSALERMVGVLDADERIALVASARYVINERSEVISTMSEYLGKDLAEGTAVIRDCLLEQKNKIGEPSVVLFRRRLADRGFDSKYRQIVDLEMWFHILEQGNFAYIRKPLCAFRIHQDQQTQVNLGQCLNIDEPHMLLTDYSRKPYIRFSPIRRAYMYFVPSYGLWRLYKKHRKISRQEALDRMEKQYGYGWPKFVIFFPMYRLYKSYLSIRRRMVKIRAALRRS